MSFAALLAAADRAAIDNLGSQVRYTPSPLVAEGVVDLQGVFSDASARAAVGQAGVMSVGPAVFVRLQDLKLSDGTLLDPEEDEQAIVTVDGVDYNVHEVEKDGLGGVNLLLRAAV